MPPPSALSFSSVTDYLGPAVDFLGQAALAMILVVFMLLKREDLRNRFIRLAGNSQITTTTKAVDDAGRRVSRFLLMQVIVNATYGIVLSAGLYFLGVDHAFLWGFIAAVLRYVPYVGAPAAALFPITLSAATSPSCVASVRASPQSITYTSPKSPTITFSGFRSRWITPLRCANATASHTRPSTASARSRGHAASPETLRSSTSTSVAPRTRFIAKYGLLAASRPIS